MNHDAYLREVFGTLDAGAQDAFLDDLMPRAIRAGLPDIAVPPETGRLLQFLARLATDNPQARGYCVEIGTLAGYSAICIARGMGYGTQLFTIEANDLHADFAQHAFEDADVSDRVKVIRGAGLEELPRLAVQLGAGGLDMLFLDADKGAYPEYFKLATHMLRQGGLLVADNALASKSWSISDPEGSSDDRDAVDRFNRTVARDGRFSSIIIPVGHGVLVAIKNVP